MRRNQNGLIGTEIDNLLIANDTFAVSAEIDNQLITIVLMGFDDFVFCVISDKNELNTQHFCFFLI